MRFYTYAPLLAALLAIAGAGAWLAPLDGTPATTTGPGGGGGGGGGGNAWATDDVRISDPSDQFQGDVTGFYEPSIAVDPNDPDTMLMFALDFSVQNHDASQYSVVRGYRSTDGGQTWTHLGVVDYDPVGSDVHDGGDPVVVFDADGVAYLATLGYYPPGAGTSVYLHRSTDGGETWAIASVPVPAYSDAASNTCSNPDKEWLSVDPNTGDLLLTYTLFSERCEGLEPVFGLDTLVPTDVGVFFMRSDDGGDTWGTPQRIWTAWALGSVPKVAPDGTIHVAMWSSIPLPESPCPTALGVVAAQEAFNAIVVASSTDDGASWTYHVQGVCSTIALADAIHPGRVVGGNVNPTLAIDPVAGDVFVAYPELIPSEARYAVRIIGSTDAGATWSAPSLVTPGPHDALLPTMVATPDSLRLAYVEARDDGSADTYYTSAGTTTVQYPGGLSWSSPTRLSSESGQLGLYPDVGPYRDPHTGDYISIDLRAGRIAVTWSDARAGEDVQIYVRTGAIA